MPNSRIWDRRLQRSQIDGIQRKGILEETMLEEAAYQTQTHIKLLQHVAHLSLQQISSK